MKEDLKSCPFCGGEAIIISKGFMKYVVKCKTCKASIKTKTISESITMWNKRACKVKITANTAARKIIDMVRRW